MNHNVYDTCVTLNDDSKMYFDVLLPTHHKQCEAKEFALDWLHSINIAAQSIESCSNHFCHNAITSPHVAKVIAQQGYAIIKSKGCPGYYC